MWGFPLPAFAGLTAAEMVDAAYRGALDAFWIVGGNFLETLPDPAAVARALARVGTRIHQDIVLTSMMLLPPADTVVLFPATTRYESPGGGTETSTERRIIFSPEVAGPPHRLRQAGVGGLRRGGGPRAAGAARRCASRRRSRSATRSRARCRSTPGIERLGRQGDQFQWGGPRLFADGVFAHAGRQGALLGRDAAATAERRPRARSTSRRAAASSSTPWSSTTWTR